MAVRHAGPSGRGARAQGVPVGSDGSTGADRAALVSIYEILTRLVESYEPEARFGAAMPARRSRNRSVLSWSPRMRAAWL